MNEIIRTEPGHLSRMGWDEYRTGMTARGGGEGGPGSGWIQYPAIRGKSIHGRLAILPAGHEVSDMVAGADLVILAMNGHTEIEIDGTIHRLDLHDMAMLPSGTRYIWRNPSLTNGQCYFTYGCSAPDFSDAAASNGGSPVIEHWVDYARDFKWTLPRSDTWGYRRGSGPYFGLPMLRGHTVRQPIGQTTPWHYAPRDLLFTVVSGEIAFHCGNRIHTLGPRDMLIIPAEMPYRYQNSGIEEVFFLSIGGALIEGKKGRYFEEDPGWPIRDDAKTLNTSIDPYGNAAATS